MEELGALGDVVFVWACRMDQNSKLMAGIVDSRLLQCFPHLYREAKHLQWFLPMPMHYVSERDHAHVWMRQPLPDLPQTAIQ